MNRQALLSIPKASIIRSAIAHTLGIIALGFLMAYTAIGAAGWL